MKKKLAVLLAVVSGVYLFVPEPTDAIPFIGWLDEGVALAMFAWSMRMLGVTPGSVMRKLRGAPAVEEKALNAPPSPRAELT